MESMGRIISACCTPFPVNETHLCKEHNLKAEVEKVTHIPEEDLVTMLTDAIKELKISGISSIFFNDAEGSCVWAGKDHTKTVANIAVPLLTWKICKVVGANNKGNERLVLHKWISALESREASVMFEDMSKQWLMDKTEINQYFENNNIWCHQLEKNMLSQEKNITEEKYFLKCAISVFKEAVFLKEVEQACNRPEKVGSNLILYGNKVKTWLSDPQGPTNHGLVINWGSFKTEYDPNLGIGGCFTADTNILVEKGNSINIATLKNRFIVCNDGTLGDVSDNKTQLLITTNRKIYGFNGGKPFFTGNHPFMTPEGWKAIEPVIAKSFNQWLCVGQLQIGDFVKKIINYDRKSNSVVYKWEKITDLPSAILVKGQTIYNINLREGLKSCHANNYVAHVSYIENAGSSKIQEGFYTNTNPEYRSRCVNDILEMSQNSALKHHIPLEEVYLADMNVTYPLNSKQVARIPKEHGHLLNGFPTNILVDRGTISIDGVHIRESALISAHQLAWRRELLHGGLEEGVIHFHPHRLSGYGEIMLTPGGTEVPEPYVISFNAHLSSHNFLCDLFTPNNVKYEEPGVQSFHLGHDQGPMFDRLTSKVDGMLPYLQLFDIGQSMNFSITEWNEATFEISIAAEYRPLIGFAHLSGVFSRDYTRFTGKAIQYDPSMLGGEGVIFTWNGRLTESQQPVKRGQTMPATQCESVSYSSTAAFCSVLRRTIHQNTEQKYFSASTTDCPMMTIPLSTQQESFQALNTKPSVMTMTRNLEDLSKRLTMELNFTDLMNITPPDQTEVHNLTFSMVKEAMEYVISDEWRKDLLGISKPDLLHGMDKIAEQYKKMLIKKYGVGYLTHSLASGDLYKNKFSENDRNKLLFFWAGGQDGCLSKDADFSNMYFSTSLIAFKLLTPKLTKYLDSADPARWAKKLHDYLVLPSQLDKYASSCNTTDVNEIIQKQCMVLQSLAPTEKYGSDLYTKVVLRNLQKRMDFFIGDNSMGMMAFINESNKSVIERVLEKDPKFKHTYVKDMNTVIQDAVTELNVEVEGKTNKEIAWLLTKQIEGSISEFISIWKEQSGTLWWRHSQAITQFSSNRPGYILTAKLISNLFGIAFWGMAMYETINTFMGWSKLSNEQTVEVVFSSADFAVSSLSQIDDIVTELNKVRKGFFTKDFIFKMLSRNNFSNASSVTFRKGFLEIASSVTDNEGSNFQEDLAKAAARNSESKEAIATSTTRIQKKFTVLEKAAQLTTVLALVASAIALGFRIYNDLKEGQPGVVVALNIVQDVLMGLQISIAVMKLLNLAPNFISVACLPIISSLLALAGIIKYLISIFTKKDKPPPQTPAEQFITAESKPFLSTLNEPTQNWLDDYKKRHPKPKIEGGQ